MGAAFQLHGYPVSNWFNCVRAALIEKGLDGDFVLAVASQDAPFLACSPMGKIPWLETPEGSIAESAAIFDYIEEAVPVPSLRPDGAYQRAKMREALSIIQLYLEAPLREFYPQVFMGAEGAVQTKKNLPTVLRAMDALERLAAFDPFFLGNKLTQVDLALFYTLELGERVAHQLFDNPLLAGRPTMQAWDKAIRARPATGIVLADFARTFADYLQAKGAAWDEAAYQNRVLDNA